MPNEMETGDSASGSGPNPHSGKKDSGDFRGGQSDQAYYGDGQLGEQEVGENENATSTEGRE